MKPLLRRLTLPVYNRIHWSFRNSRDGHSVESASVSRKARIGAHSIVRRGVEMGADVELGDYSYVSGPGTYVESARIGRFCSIARRTVIGVSGKDMSRVTTHNFVTSPSYGGLVRTSNLPDQKPPPVIGHDVWIGVNAVILRGAVIGHGAVIGANAVVGGTVPPYAIVGGIPARRIRDRFTEAQIEGLLRTAWWDWPRERLVERAADFMDIDAFLGKYHPGR